jgi:hypothetical protein
VTPSLPAIVDTLRTRFAAHPTRHPNLTWAQVLARLDASPGALASLQAMEDTGGEPDVIAHDPSSGAVTFADCSAESPSGRRSLCYDDEALDARKEARPAGSAAGMATAMGVTLLTEAQYAQLQTLGAFDRKTSSWLLTPAAVRTLGGAIFGDRRYERVFTYHNGAQSYYAARGFRASLTV